MSRKAPGKNYRKGMTIVEFVSMFPDDSAAEFWFIKERWPTGICCSRCGSLRVQTGCRHKTMPFRCKEKPCRKKFSVKTGTVMQGSKLGYQKWILAMYLVSTSLKGVASMKLHRDLGISQKSAWFLAHRIRAALDQNGGFFAGPVEVDETYRGGKRKNMPKSKRKKLTGRGPVGKTAVVGAKDRPTKQVAATVARTTDKETLHGFVKEHADEDATVYTDDAPVYDSLPFDHESVKHSVGEYVRGEAHTNGVESFWSMLKRAHMGTFHKMSPKHLDRYVQEFAGRHNMREQDTIDMLRSLASGMKGKHLPYKVLIKDNGLDSGARA